MSLFSKIIISVSSGAIIIILLSGYFVYSFASKLMYSSVSDYHKEILVQKNNKVDNLFRDAKEEISVFSVNPDFIELLTQGQGKEGPYSKCYDHSVGQIQQNIQLSEVWKNLYLFNNDRELVLSNTQNSEQLVAEDKLITDILQQASSNLDRAIMMYKIDINNSEKVRIFLADALVVDGGHQLGTIVGEFDWEEVAAVMNEVNKQYHLRVVSLNGYILASNHEGEAGAQEIQWGVIKDKQSTQASSLRSITDLGSFKNDQEFISFIGNPEEQNVHFGWGLVLGAPVETISSPTIKITAAISLIFILLMIVMVDITIFVLYRFVIEPVESITEIARDITRGNLSKRIKPRYRDEVGLLAEEFNAMTSELENINRDLEDKVRIRTQELAEKVEQIKRQNQELQQAKEATSRVLVEVSEEKKNAEEARKKMGVVIEEIYDGVMIVDQKASITSLNKEGYRLLKHGKEEVLGQNSLQVLQPQTEKGKKITNSNDPIWLALTKGKSTRDKILTFKKGSYHRFTARVSVSPLIVDNCIFGAAMIFRDITRDLEIDRQKTEFISIASHQLRTPLSSIKWFLEMLLGGDTGKVNKQQKDFLQEAAEGTERMIKLVNDLLNVSRIEQERVAIEPKLHDFLKLVRSVVREVRPMAKEKQTTIVIKAPKSLPKFKYDDELIRQVIQNLLTNAIKYTPEKGHIEISVQELKDELQFDIKDNGYGIPEDAQKNIFNKFFRAKNVLSREAEGNGLGLYLAKAVVESSGGRIWFNSEQMKGTTFHFTLPTKTTIIRKGEVKLNS